MRVMLTGATGMVGSSVLTELVRSGHRVTAVVRSAQSAATVQAAGGDPVTASLTDAVALAALIADSDAAIHAASLQSAPAAGNDAFVTAALSADGAAQRPVVLTSGSWIHGSGDIHDDSPLAPPALVCWRIASETRLLLGTTAATVLAPGIVHSDRPGLWHELVDGPVDELGRRRLIGDGRQRWSWVHADDLADLYRRVIEAGSGAGRLLAARPGPPVGDLVRAVRGDAVVASTEAQTRERFGADFGDALLLNQTVTAAKAEALGWRPSRSLPVGH